MNAPRLVITPIVRPHPDLLGANRDAFADEMLAREREYLEAMEGLPPTAPLTAQELQHLADIDAEKRTEGQRVIPRPNYRIEP